MTDTLGASLSATTTPSLKGYKSYKVTKSRGRVTDSDVKQNHERGAGELAGIVGILFAVIFLGGLTIFGLWGCPKYYVYTKRLEGEGLLAHAQSTKEVAV